MILRQIASGLFRQTLVDHSNCRAGRPSLTLEPDGSFSPLLHMVMQSELVHQLAERFSAPSNVKTHEQLMEYKGMVDEWMLSFPPIFALVNPDTSNDKKQVWIEYHRHYNYTMGYMMLLNPFRPHMQKTYTDQSSEEMLELRRVVIDLTLLLVRVLDNWLKFLTFRDGRFHFIIFSLVDAATVLSNVVVNDKTGEVPRRDDIYRAAKLALVLQRKLLFLSESAKVAFRIVQKLVRRMFRGTPPGYMASLKMDDGNDGGDPQEALPPSNQTSDHGALMTIQNIDPEASVAPEFWDQLAVEAPIEGVVDVAASQFASGHNAGTVISGPQHRATAPCHCTECTELATHTQCQTVAPQDTADASGTTSVAVSYTEPTFSYNADAVPLEYIPPTSSQAATATSPYYAASTPLNLLATTPAYVESMFPEHTSLVSSDEASFAPPVHAVVAPWDYTARSSYTVDTPPHVEPTLEHHGHSAASGFAIAPPPTEIIDFATHYTAGAFPDHTAATPLYVEPALLSTYPYNNAIPAAEHLAVPNLIHAGAISTPSPLLVPDTSTAYSASTPSLSLTDFTEAGPYTSPESFYDSSAYEPSVLYPSSVGYDASASHTSPASYTSLEGYSNPAAVYDTPASCTASLMFDTSAFLASPESYTSPESHGVTEARSDTITAQEGMPCASADNKDDVGSFHDTLSYTTPPNDTGNPDVSPRA